MKAYQDVLSLKNALEAGEITSEDMVRFYLKRIETYDDNLNSLADLNADAILEAKRLDQMRKANKILGPMHGIPLVIKDNILSKDSMRTTANAEVFKDFFAPYDATIVKKLRESGAIILAKGNCSEFAYFMSMGKMPSGYGSMHGQVIHPYDKTLDPLGSSTGSAVSVAAGLSPISIGTETNGSLASPAQANSVVTIKPTLGLVSRYGIVPISRYQDTAGPMSLTVKDAALLLDVIKGKDQHDPYTDMIPKETCSYLNACDDPIKGMKIGILSFEKHEEAGEEKAILEEAQQIFEQQHITVETIKIPYDLPNNLITMIPEFKRDLNQFLSTVQGHTPINSLEELIAFNKEHPQKRLRYGQQHFQAAQMTDGRLKDPTYLKTKRAIKKSIDTFLKLFDQYHLDAIVTTKITGYAPMGGLPLISIPAKPLNDKKPCNLLFIGRTFSEQSLLPLAHRYEKQTKKRIQPNLDH